MCDPRYNRMLKSFIVLHKKSWKVTFDHKLNFNRLVLDFSNINTVYRKLLYSSWPVVNCSAGSMFWSWHPWTRFLNEFGRIFLWAVWLVNKTVVTSVFLMNSSALMLENCLSAFVEHIIISDWQVVLQNKWFLVFQFSCLSLYNLGSS